MRRISASFNILYLKQFSEGSAKKLVVIYYKISGEVSELIPAEISARISTGIPKVYPEKKNLRSIVEFLLQFFDKGEHFVLETSTYNNFPLATNPGMESIVIYLQARNPPFLRKYHWLNCKMMSFIHGWH